MRTAESLGVTGSNRGSSALTVSSRSCEHFCFAEGCMRLGIRGSGNRWVVGATVAFALLEGTTDALAATLTISGTPATVVMPGDYYQFTPVVSGNSGTRRLRFSIANKPGWAYFNQNKGSLTGAPRAS